jgi:hypothetical protein
MSRNHRECPDSDDSDRWELPNVLVRQEPDEEEDEEEEEEEGNGKDDNDHDSDHDGYSE